MYSILYREQLSDDVVLMRLAAPLIAEERKPGQFVIVQLDSKYGERIPLTIADADPKEGSITIIFQVVGLTTHRLADLHEGDAIENLVGPLGRPTHIEAFGTVVCIGGGIGVAPMYPIAQGMKRAGNKVIIIMGARTKNLLILEPRIRSLADEQGENAIGVILSGSGSDGTLGLRAIHGAGGVSFVQDPSTAKYEGMPNSAGSMFWALLLIIRMIIKRALPKKLILFGLVK